MNGEKEERDNSKEESAELRKEEGDTLIAADIFDIYSYSNVYNDPGDLFFYVSLKNYYIYRWME